MPTSPTPDDIRAFRQRLNLSQEALAARLGVSERGVSEWERGNRTPPAYLADALSLMDLVARYEAGMIHEAAEGDAPMTDVTGQALARVRDLLDDVRRRWASERGPSSAG